MASCAVALCSSRVALRVLGRRDTGTFWQKIPSENPSRAFSLALLAARPNALRRDAMDPLAPSITFYDKETGKGRTTYLGMFG